MKRFIFVFSFLLAFVLVQAQSVSLAFYDKGYVLDSCSGCKNPYRMRYFDGVKVSIGNRKPIYLSYPIDITRTGSSLETYELKEIKSGNSARFKHNQLNSGQYPTAGSAFDSLVAHMPGASGGSFEMPYRSYVATLTQSGTANPVANVLYNTLGTVVWTRGGVGSYDGTISNYTGAANKLFVVYPTLELNNNFAYDYAIDVIGGDMIISFHTYDASGMRTQDFPPLLGNLDETWPTSIPFNLEIRAYD